MHSNQDLFLITLKIQSSPFHYTACLLLLPNDLDYRKSTKSLIIMLGLEAFLLIGSKVRFGLLHEMSAILDELNASIVVNED